MIDLRTVRLVAAKELLESLRDRRTLFVALVLPVLLYPLVTLGIGSLVGAQKRKLAEAAQPIALTGEGAETLRRVVLEPPSRPDAAPGGSAAPDVPTGLAVVPSADPRADLAAGRIALWVEAPAEFPEALAKDGTARVRAHYDGSDDRSRQAWLKWRQAFDAATLRVLGERLSRQGLAAEWSEPLHCVFEDLSPPGRTGAFLFGKILPLLLVLMTLTSSFYPAVDAVAGEKERGTMETLLVAPCRRVELVLGKFVAVLAVTLASAALNLASLALTTGPVLSAVGPGQIPPLEVTPEVIAGILLLLVPISVLFSAISLSVSTLARSVKEANHYLTPIVVLVMPLAAVVALPDLPLTPTLAAVPVTSAVLFFRDLMIGKTEWGTTALVFASTLGAAVLALWACVSLFLEEETLFRGPEGSGRGLLARPAPRETPSAGSAVFLFAASLAVLWYGQSRLPQEIVANVLATQFGIVLLPCVLLAFWFRLRPAATFRLSFPPRARAAIALAVPIGLALPVVNLALRRAFVGDTAPSEAFRVLQERIDALVRDTSAPVLLLLLAVLPAVCEELVYRGYLLTAFRDRFRGRGAAARAVVLSAVLFALFHVFPERWLPTFTVGVVLAWVALRTGSLWPGVVVHAVNNAVPVLAQKAGEGSAVAALFDPAHPRHAVAVAIQVAVLAAALVVLGWLTRRAPRETGAAAGTADGATRGT